MATRSILFGMIGSAVLLLPAAGYATTLRYSGGTQTVLTSGFDPAPGIAGLGPGASVQRSASLFLDTPSVLTFSYLGSEAGGHNQFWTSDGQIFDNQSATNGAVSQMFGGGLVPLFFRDVSKATDVANGASLTSDPFNWALYQASGSVFYALFNDGGSDADYDDLAVRIDLAPAPAPSAASRVALAAVPLPPAAGLMLTALLGLGLAARRRIRRH
jgi:hypothetical protein